MKKILVVSILLLGVAHISYGQTCTSRGPCDILLQDCPATYTCVTNYGVATTRTDGQCFSTAEVNRGSCIPPSSMGLGGGRGTTGSGSGVSPAQSPADAMRLAMQAFQSSSLGRSLAASAQRNCPAAQRLNDCGNVGPGKGYLRIASHTSSDTCPGADFANQCFKGAPGSIVNSATARSTQLTDEACRAWACGTPPPSRGGGVFGPRPLACGTSQYICPNGTCSMGGVCYGQGNRNPNWGWALKLPPCVYQWVENTASDGTAYRAWMCLPKGCTANNGVFVCSVN